MKCYQGLVAATALLGSACREPVAPGPLALRLTASDTIVATGGALSFSVKGLDSLGDTLPVNGILWTVNDPRRGRVTENGVFTGGPDSGRVWVRAALAEPALAESVEVRVGLTGTVRWRFAAAEAGGVMPIMGGPALGLDGTLYVLVQTDDFAREAELVAIDNQGRRRWQASLSGIELDYPVVAPTGEIVVAGRRLYVIQPDGRVRWELAIGPPPFGGAGAAVTTDLIVAAHRRHVRAFRLDNGDSVWQFSDTLAFGELPPTIVGNNLVYAKKTQDSLCAFRLSDGVVEQTYPDPDPQRTSGMLGMGPVPAGNRIYLPTNSLLVAYGVGGTLLWLTEDTGNGVTEPAVGPDGTLYIQHRRFGLEALDRDGNQRWFRRRDEVPRWPSLGGPALAAGGIIYAAGREAFFAYDARGTLRWKFVADTTPEPGGGFPLGAFVGAPAIGPDGTVYTFTASHVYAFFAAAPPEPNSPWPMWRHDAQRTGWVR